MDFLKGFHYNKIRYKCQGKLCRMVEAAVQRRADRITEDVGLLYG